MPSFSYSLGEVCGVKRTEKNGWKRRAKIVICAVCLAAGICLLLEEVFDFEPATVFGGERKPLILIDPGHGGIDGGAESSGGICEKDINLKISLMLREKLEDYDIDVMMTREEDRGLYTGVKNDGTEEMEIEGKRSIRSLKSEDLNQRKKMADKLEPDAFVSIHLNSFRQDRSARGAQVFFSPGADEKTGEQSRQLAELIQQAFREQSDGVNQRQAMRKNDVLIMKNARVPTVIAECGFLSNLNEAFLLTDEAYQKELAESIKKGILLYLGIDEEKERNAEKEDSEGSADSGAGVRIVDSADSSGGNNAENPGKKASV